jgi:hypothetical protein
MVNDWSGGSIDKEVYDYIRKVLPEGSTILELGSGWATGQLAKHYTMYSVEHNPEYLDKQDSTYIHAPLVEHKKINNEKSTMWYDIEALRPKLKGIKYDLLLIDGPPGNARAGFIKYVYDFDPTVIMVFDDTDRGLDLRAAMRAANKLELPFVTYRSSTKSFSVINDPHLKGVV